MVTPLQSWLKKAGRLLPMALLPFASHAQAPVNDNPTGAIALPLTTTCTPTSGSNVGAFTTPTFGLGYTNPGCGLAGAPRDVWYTFTTNASGQQGSTAATITVTGNPAGQVRVFGVAAGSGGPFTEVGCSAGTTNNTVAPPLQLRGLTPATSYYVFVSGYASNDAPGAFTICAQTLPLEPNDVAVQAIYSLGKVSQTFGAPHVAQAVVTNLGSGPRTNVPVTLTVSGATTFTSTQTVASLAPNATAVVTFLGYSLATLGTNTLTVTVPADDNGGNNALTMTQLVTAADQSYIDTAQPLATSGVRVGVANDVLAVRYHSNTAAAVHSITPTFVTASTGTATYQLQVYSANGAVPGPLLYTSTPLTRPAAPGAVPTAVPGIPVNGDFYVAIKELNNDVVLGNQPEAPLRSGTFFHNVTGGTTWVDLSTNTTQQTRLALDVTLGTRVTCNIATGLTVGFITATSARLNFTAPAGATSYTVTVTPQGGTATTITPAPTASPVSLTGLTAGTTYTVSVTTNCGATSGSSTAVTTTFTTLAPVPANDNPGGAIALPVSATCASTNATNAEATVTPPSGYTNPSSPSGCGVAASPRDVWFTFTTNASGAGSTSANITVTGNPAGSIRVFSSTAGATGPFTQVGCSGSTAFNTVAPALTLTGLTPATTYYVSVAGYGSADTPGAFTICIVASSVSAARHAFGNGALSTFPNPTSRAFTLAVPAVVSARTARITLLNNLGQQVQSRTVALDANGTQVPMDAAGLATGLYLVRIEAGGQMATQQVVVE